MNKIKLSEIIKISKPTYKYFKLTPNNSIRNQSTHKIARSISSIYKNIFHQIKKDEEKLIKVLGKDILIGTKFSISINSKVGYYIYIEKSKVEFYFIVPDRYKQMMEEKFTDVWSNVTIKEVDDIPRFNNSTSYQLQYEKEDGLSLSVDRRNNELLKSNLNIVNVLEGDDRVGLYYNFIPTMQHSWKSSHRSTIKKVYDKAPVERNKGSISYIMKFVLNSLVGIVEAISNSLTTSNNKDDESRFSSIIDLIGKRDTLSDATIKKENAVILDTQILVISSSKDKVREINNARSLTQSFETVSEDNRLIPRQYKKNIDFDSYRIKGVKPNKVSDVECQNFISLAGRELLEEYNFIEAIETNESQVPDELRNGVIRIGSSTFRGKSQDAYLSNDNEYKNLAQILVGPTRAGKSTLIGNMAYDMIKNNECVIMFDFIKNCELSSEVSQLFEKDKILNIECNDFEQLQGLGYNEVGFSDDVFKQYDNAKRQTTQLMTLVNSINADETGLTAKMERYLTSAALVSFIIGGSIKDVFDILQNHDIRRSFISKIPSDQDENMSEYIMSLRSLDDLDKEGNIKGTKLNLIVGIIDRLNKLKANTYMELMLKKSTKNNIDLSNEIQKNQLICIKMPEDMFSTDGERDVYTTYWITKLWLALQMRGKNINDRSKHTKVNLIIDELYQVNNTEKFLTDKLSRLAKFSIKPVISCHYINQLKYMRSELRSANASYMLISGCDKFNYNEFKEELYPFTMEDLLKLKRYHSLNLIKHTDGYGKFITKLPKPISLKNS